ncbi:MAG: hypothetical protein M3N47_12165, partial [Chloroflexota bacterium]|nr:hypothetical protein [Chloroflexota bacterium]
MNITLRDLLRWSEIRLRPARLRPTQSSVPSPQSSPEAALLRPDHEVSWPVTMRATPPMLPHVDAGALVLLPATTLAEVRAGLPGALRELKRRGVAALVIDLDAAVEAGDLDLLCSPEPVNAELEATLARVVNARRARLYRRGTELDRALTEATLHGRGVSRLLAIGATQGEREVLLLDERGRIGEAAGPSG